MEKESTEDEMIRQHHQLNGYEFEQTLGDSESEGSLVCCNPWDHKESDTTQQLNNNKIQKNKTGSFMVLFFNEAKIIFKG